MARRNDSAWRAEVLEKRGLQCRRCRTSSYLQADHLRPRSQGGPSVVENGLVLCRRCHTMKTEHRILIEKSWLDEDQVEWLKEVRWAWWEDDGDVWGEGRKSFAPERTT